MRTSLDPNPKTRREIHHELWLEMRAAYNAYKQAAEAYEVEASYPSQGIFLADRTERLTIVAAVQLAAFENYVEARLDYSEFTRDEDGTLVVQPVPEYDHAPERRRARIPINRPLLTAVGGLLVCIIGLSYTLSNFDRERAGDIKLTRQSSQKVQAHAQSPPMSKKIGDLKTANPDGKITTTPLTPRRSDVPERTTQFRSPRGWAPSSSSPGAGMPLISPNHRETSSAGHSLQRLAVRKSPWPNEYEVELTRSRTFTQVGPVGLSLRKVDGQRTFADLLIRMKGSKPMQKHLRLNTPVRIVTQGSRRIELVATAMRSNHVHARMIELKNDGRPSAELGCTENCLAGSSNAEHQEVGRISLERRPAGVARRPINTGDSSTR